MKPEQRMDELNKQMKRARRSTRNSPRWWRSATNTSPTQRAKAPPKASSFDRVVEDTLKAQIKR